MADQPQAAAAAAPAADQQAAAAAAADQQAQPPSAPPTSRKLVDGPGSGAAAAAAGADDAAAAGGGGAAKAAAPAPADGAAASRTKTPPRSNTPRGGKRSGTPSRSPATRHLVQQQQQQPEVSKEEQERIAAEEARRAEEEAKRIEEEDRYLRPWLSPAGAGILRKSSTNASAADADEGGAAGAAAAGAGDGDGDADAKKQANAAKPANQQQQQQQAGGGAAAQDNNNNNNQHHIQFADGGPQVFADFAFARTRQIMQDRADAIQEQREQFAHIPDVCERLYAEGIAKQRLKDEAEQRKARAIATGEDDGVDDDPNCTFHPVISASAAAVKYEDWAQFMAHRDQRTADAKRRWKKKLEANDKKIQEIMDGEDEKKMAPMSERLLAYKAQRGEPHRGPVANYDHYLGKFILKKTSPEKGVETASDGDSQERRRRSVDYASNQREQTRRLYDDAVARVAARQVVERARVAAERAKLFQPMTNERLIAKLKELNPDAENESYSDEMLVENRLLSQGESYRLRKERRKNQHVMESTAECTFTPRTNPKSRQLLQQWARRVEQSGRDPAAAQSVMRVDRDLNNNPDYAPLNGAPGSRVFTTEAEALAALQAVTQGEGVLPGSGGGAAASGVRRLDSSASTGSATPRTAQRRVVADPDAYFERVKLRQAERERQMAEKRRQHAAARQEGCTFRPAMAPLTVALARIRDDREFGHGDDQRGHREIMMKPHLREPSAEWGRDRTSPRKMPGAGGTHSHNSSAARQLYNNAHHPRNTSQQRGGIGGGGAVAAAPGGGARGGGSAASSAARRHAYGSGQRLQHADPSAASSEHFLADLEHELAGVISDWQN